MFGGKCSVPLFGRTEINEKQGSIVVVSYGRERRLRYEESFSRYVPFSVSHKVLISAGWSFAGEVSSHWLHVQGTIEFLSAISAFSCHCPLDVVKSTMQMRLAEWARNGIAQLTDMIVRLLLEKASCFPIAWRAMCVLAEELEAAIP